MGGGGGEGRNFEKVSKVCKLISKIVATKGRGLDSQPWSGTDFSAYKFCSRLDYFCQKNLKIPLLPIFLNTSGPTASSCRNAVHYQCDLFHRRLPNAIFFIVFSQSSPRRISSLGHCNISLALHRRIDVVV